MIYGLTWKVLTRFISTWDFRNEKFIVLIVLLFYKNNNCDWNVIIKLWYKHYFSIQSTCFGLRWMDYISIEYNRTIIMLSFRWAALLEAHFRMKWIPRTCLRIAMVKLVHFFQELNQFHDWQNCLIRQFVLWSSFEFWIKYSFGFEFYMIKSPSSLPCFSYKSW